jgi:hypothetical protein
MRWQQAVNHDWTPLEDQPRKQIISCLAEYTHHVS